MQIGIIFRKPLIAMLAAVLCLMACPESANAQHKRKNNEVVRAYPSIGATLSQIRGDELRGFKKAGVTVGFGTLFSLDDKDRWHMSIEACFSQRGSKNRTITPYALYGLTLNYVDIPVSFHFTDPYGGMTFGIGVCYSRLVQQPHGLIQNIPTDLVPDTTDFTFLKNDLAIALDFRFPLWKNLMVNVRYQHSIIPIKRNFRFTQYHSSNEGDFDTWENDCYNSSLMFRLIYVFGSSKR